ncbi:peptidoglycan editing factor PgeF [Alkalibacillus haloalkaliphilus]|uniref:Purine nucleoside phosphorylase n=1 Tax=Alkalibacillus haloalkaliphilus TaxID=94136 RepID=A0A511W235_9BACI|nr:peptidoglycan editing factor PgeF [Alkalibacillus haloalkaliphilus]GEN44831.1 laccase domain protein [Alkalibacillus haloalkaliphilus]
MAEILDQNYTSYLLNSKWKELGFTAGFSTRLNGYSNTPYNTMNVGIHVNDEVENVLKNRQYISEQIEQPLEQWCCLNQVHSTKVIDLTETNHNELSHDNPNIDADGMITNDPSHSLVTFYADCVPLYFIAPERGWIGLAHAGWKGTVGGISHNVVEALLSKGVQLEELKVMIGPCISQEHYEVDERVIEQIPQKYYEKVLKPSHQGRYLLDLKMLNYLYLKDLGLSTSKIETSQYCTYEDEQLFFSFRRDKGQTGRMMAMLSL